MWPRMYLVGRCGKDKGPRSYHVARACTLAPAGEGNHEARGPAAPWLQVSLWPSF